MAEKLRVDCYVGSRKAEARGDQIQEEAVEGEVGSFTSAKPRQGEGEIASALAAVEQEPVFGQVKSNLGFVRFLLRGLKKASGEWALICLVHNIRRIYAYLKAKGASLTERLAMVYAC